MSAGKASVSKCNLSCSILLALEAHHKAGAQLTRIHERPAVGKNTGDQNRILLDSPPGETSVFPLPTMSVSVVDLPPEMLKEVHNSFPRPHGTTDHYKDMS